MAAYYRTSHSIDDGVVTDVAPDLLRDVILPSDLLSSEECGDDFRRMYALRVEAEIARDHARLRQALGEGKFAVIVRDFLRADSAVRDIARASARFAAYFRAEAERDPALWIARTVALRRRGAFRGARGSRLGYARPAHASTALDARGRGARDVSATFEDRDDPGAPQVVQADRRGIRFELRPPSSSPSLPSAHSPIPHPISRSAEQIRRRAS